MEVTSKPAQQDSAEVRAALLLKRAIKTEQTQQLALIESARTPNQSLPLDSRLVGRNLNEKA
jgi:hypothetical protein